MNRVGVNRPSASLLVALVASISVTAAAQRPAATAATGAPGAAAEDAVPPAEDPREEARRDFEAGMRALQQERFDGAVVYFERSLELAPRAATAFNLALALHRAGRSREALDVASRLADETYGPLPERRREEVERLRGTIEENLANLAIRLEGADTATVRIDGQRAGTVVAGEPFSAWLEPGPHDVVADLADGPSLEDRVEVEAGERLRMLLNVATGTVVVETERRPAWPWVLLGVGLAAVAGGAVAAVVVFRRSDGPTTDPVYGRVQTLRF